MVAIAEAITAGWRVAGFVAPVASLMRCVACAASASAAKVSPWRFCESVNAMPSQPSRSTISASAAARPAVGNVPSQNSMATLGALVPASGTLAMQALLDLVADPTGVFWVQFIAAQIPDVEDVQRAIGMRRHLGVVDIQAKIVQRAGDAIQQPNSVGRADFHQAEDLRCLVVDRDAHLARVPIQRWRGGKQRLERQAIFECCPHVLLESLPQAALEWRAVSAAHREHVQDQPVGCGGGIGGEDG